MAEARLAVELLETDLCLVCRFAEVVTVLQSDGSTCPVIKCTRKDCDNWITTKLKTVEVVEK